DIFSYFGLGCRNVSKIFVPEKYSIPMLFDHWKKFEPVICHHKYANNYDYQKAIMMVNKTPFYDSGFVLITESKNLVSPISVVYYETYHSISDLTEKLIQAQNKIQCIVRSIDPASIPFGQAQFPGPGDYADKVDTMKFLIGLSKA
ncbi:MAG TPA: acyl-CoA reductase, partial [Cyclobacteriaceae bacterium]|nr:acyl-CoA reductase [Cyclobacteriaceae bacterium]